jgi:hypothetical protein
VVTKPQSTDRHSARVQLALQLATRPEDRAKALERLNVPELLDLSKLTLHIGGEALAEIGRRTDAGPEAGA